MKNQNNDEPKNVYIVANAQIFPIKNKVSKLGRRLENDLVIQDSVVSRFHAEIHYKNGTYYLHDKNSTGGTFVNNKKIDKAVIKSGDTIMLANIPLLFLVERTDTRNYSEDPEYEQEVENIVSNSKGQTKPYFK